MADPMQQALMKLMQQGGPPQGGPPPQGGGSPPPPDPGMMGGGMPPGMGGMMGGAPPGGMPPGMGGMMGGGMPPMPQMGGAPSMIPGSQDQGLMLLQQAADLMQQFLESRGPDVADPLVDKVASLQQELALAIATGSGVSEPMPPAGYSGSEGNEFPGDSENSEYPR